jgi:hypothetical protein
MHLSGKITCICVEINFVVTLGTLLVFGGLAFASYTHRMNVPIRNYQIIAHFQPFASTSQVFQNFLTSSSHGLHMTPYP